MTQLIRYLTADLANTAYDSLEFPGDEKSQRAQRASRNRIDVNSDKITKETLFQIVTLENISQSKTNKLDELLANDDMDAVGADRLRGRQPRIIRNIDLEGQENNNGQNDGGANQQSGMAGSGSNASNYFKLTLQDCGGTLVYGIEIEKLQFLKTQNFKSGFPTQLGSKILINNADIVHGVLLLKPSNTEFLSGVVPAWNIDLAKKHMAYLKNELEKQKLDSED